VPEQAATTATGQRPVNIVGERLVLGPFDRDLIDTYWRWLNDFGMLRTISHPVPNTRERVLDDYRQIGDDAHQVSFTIYERATGRPIGNVAWTDIDWRNGTAEYILYIGEADCRGKGYGTEVTRLMLDYAFIALGLHNVMLRVYGYNLAGYHAYQKAGFREWGRRRQCKQMGGKLWDVIFMECLATEFPGGG
jgi:RimJ/RimL family protein N-acetyltransferase